MSDDEPTAGDDEGEADHLDDLPDGSGCTEVWEYLSERREAEADGD